LTRTGLETNQPNERMHMTNAKFQKLLTATAAAQRKFGSLLKQAEEEYERRFGSNPSDWDDDFWIDSLHGACGDAAAELTVEQVTESAKLCRDMKYGECD
jgi:hypothetical protein